MTKTIQRARNSIFWPNIKNDIENITTNCKTCQLNAPRNHKEPMISHHIPDQAFKKIACDILEFKAKNYLVIVDFYSKWIELVKLQEKTASHINNKLMQIFATFGFPHVIISDNMPFGSFSCREFAHGNDIKIVTSSPNYAQSNGMAERAVQICKNILKKCSSEIEISKALLAYRSTPTKYMKYSPAQLLQNRNNRTNIPMHINKSKPSLCVDVDKQHETKAKSYFDKSARQRSPFNVDEKVIFINNNKWQIGTVIKNCEQPRSYEIESDGRIYRRNSKHIRNFHEQIMNVNNNKSNQQESQLLQKVTRSGRSY